jgi:kynurenine formamidase
MRRIIDLTHPMYSGMPVFPGSRPVRFQPVSDMSRDGFLQQYLNLPSHAGTHVDAPAHMVEGGLTLDSIPVDHFIGSGAVLRVPGSPDPCIKCADLIPYRDRVESVEMVLISTGWSRNWGTERYMAGYPFLSVEAANWLAEFPLKAVGLDTPSVDPPDSAENPSHHVFFRRNMIIIENMDRIDELPDTGFLLVCLPLRIRDADGSPARAVAFLPCE